MLDKRDFWKGWSCKNCAAGGNVQCNLLHTCVECLTTQTMVMLKTKKITFSAKICCF